MKRLFTFFAAGLMLFTFASIGFTEEQKEGTAEPKAATEAEKTVPVEKSIKAKKKKSSRLKSQPSTKTTAPEVPVPQK